MIYPYVALVMFYACAFSLEHKNDCLYNHDYRCASQIDKNVTSSIDGINLCTREQIPKVADFYIMWDEEKKSSSRGVLKIRFKSPSTVCKYKVSLFINPRINNSKDCDNYVFRKGNHTEIHTPEKTVCLSTRENKEEQAMKNTLQSLFCEDTLHMWFHYIYTGCYALGFNVDNDYIFVGNEFFVTDYQKKEVAEPKVSCSYKSTLTNRESSLETVPIGTYVSLLVGPPDIKVDIEVAPYSLVHKNEEVACNRYSESPLIKLSLTLSPGNDTDAANKNCTQSTKFLSTGESEKTIDCNFVAENSMKDTGYCLFIRILDQRCQKNTSWKPPSRDKVPCAWMQHCQKTEVKEIDVELEGDNSVQKLKIPAMLYIFGYVAAVLVVVAVSSTILVSYCLHVQKKKVFPNGNASAAGGYGASDKNVNVDSLESQKERLLVRESGIVILYVRESDEFMSFMGQFGKSLTELCGCDVYDWWAPELWNDVARLGGYEWVVNMIRKDCRIVWMDTLKARTIFASLSKNGCTRFKQLKRLENLEITDFRESVFPAILDFAKRYNQDLKREYQRHFVVRLETFKGADETEDPFADLSPHARYLLPCHLDKLCYQLSTLDVNLQDEININKVRLGKYLYYDPVLDL
ncbi:uncharacterized protein LOC106645214 [Copidosoma floridanum]|uniref:uncharacterized protein LOC106645214 n=1 Tax=Copidosoma floridanum TaxID=29053 RepID=UPI0006C98F19|nr:uncharacterized protein LOC106645214 [Copidosoma floridanum]